MKYKIYQHMESMLFLSIMITEVSLANVKRLQDVYKLRNHYQFQIKAVLYIKYVIFDKLDVLLAFNKSIGHQRFA